MASRRNDSLAERISRLHLRIRHDMEQAEAKVAQVNRHIVELGTTGLLKREVLLGKWREAPSNSEQGVKDSSRVIQAVLLVPEGLGLCQWDSEESYCRTLGKGNLESYARRKFQAFDDLASSDKAFLLPYIESLLDELLDLADVAASKSQPGRIVEAGGYLQTLRKRRGAKS